MRVQRMTGLDGLALRQLSRVTREKREVVERGEDLERQGLRERFALLEGDEAGERLRLLLDAGRQPAEPPRALLERGAPPQLRGERRGLERVLDFREVGAGDPGERLPRRRVDVRDARAGTGSRLPIDQGEKGRRAGGRTRVFEVLHVFQYRCRKPGSPSAHRDGLW